MEAQPINLKSNAIYFGDYYELLTRIPDESIDAVIVDPPYDILNAADITFEDRTDIVQNAAFDQFKTYADYLKFIEKFVQLSYVKMKKNSSFISFFATQYITDLISICEKIGMTRKTVLVWVKKNPAIHIRKTSFLSSYESIVYMVKNEPTFHFLGQSQMHNVITTGLVSQKERLKNEETKKTLHPTQKPLSVIEKLISIATNMDDLVCDAFVGTGTTNIACKKLGRYCIGFENNLLFFKASQKRLSDYQGTTNNHQRKLM